MSLTLASISPATSPDIRPDAGPVAGSGLTLVDELAALVPHRTLRRGTSVGITGATGTTSLLLRLLAGPLSTGSWAAVVGAPELNARAASELGVPLDHLALIPEPGPTWLDVTAALLDAMDIVVINPPRNARPTDSKRLLARARQRHSVLVILGNWPESPDLVFEASDCKWEGLRPGHGVLSNCNFTVKTGGRRLNGPARSGHVQLTPGDRP